MGKSHQTKRRPARERYQRLAKQLGEEKAREIMRMEDTDDVTLGHTPPDEGIHDAQARTAVRQTGRPAASGGPQPMGPAAERHREEYDEASRDGRKKARRRRQEREKQT